MLSGLNFADAEFLDQLSILDDVPVTQISLKPASLSNEEKQSAAAVEVFLVRAKVVRDLEDSGLHNRNLDFG